MNAPDDIASQLQALSPTETVGFLGPAPGVAERLDTLHHALMRHTLRGQPGDYVLVLAGNTQEWVRLAGETVVGTGPDATIRPASAFVSRRHCRLSPTVGGWLVEDLGSKNGVLVNGQRVHRHDLCSGDAIQLADVTLMLVEESPADG